MRKKLSIAILLCIFILSSYVFLEAQWAKAYGGAQHGAFTIQQTSDGGYIVAGGTFSVGVGNQDFLVLRLPSNGSLTPRPLYSGFVGDSSATAEVPGNLKECQKHNKDP